MANVTSATSSQKTIEQVLAEQANKVVSTRNTGELGKNDFLQLLITQVQHQDPLEPLSDTDFIAQMAQFSALEQMQNLNNSFAMTKAFGMIGKYVSGQMTDTETGKTSYIEGIVESVRIKGSKVYALVNGQEIEIDKITDVADISLGNNFKRISDYSGLVGMLGSAYLYNDNGDKATIQGIISSLEQRLDGIYARLDEVDVRPKDLDLSDYESPEAFVVANAGKEITVKVADPTTGTVVRVTGILRDGYLDKNGNLRLLIDGVTLPVDDIYATEIADLYSSQHMLLQQILQVLREKLGSDQPKDDSGEDEGAENDTGTTGGVE
ncbi:MAG TPA: flagellar hook capping FlgD N-terminal domain-containing protein [Thermoclostridium caenicola]|uniref:flagellar hook capping FlgD N-terminal domain-containing protein n=1 Tax=Thermoclostridium caenicola TaxID=659425 RepID=UPI002D16E59D|nr:flagellar hook capping FlgD N-terminal domain-containing protein [Thermoclostridium caenicola]HOK42048.1 flagellar hook capping FlgD N-terminal domain-containing protein [Thermoclostridium caenicola]HOP71733.1 flagellar hook capping FlgD N-terminal domain-containing protein [Thermoclostridium caenicola]HPO75839.1 flagellar hook capping FlgD N-terminal domain-containing protein [Thermoclostridium caenicola]